MLQQVLDPARWDLEVIAPATLTAELLDLVAERRPGGGLHRGDPARRPGAHPIPVQAAAVAVPRPEDPRGPLGATTSRRPIRPARPARPRGRDLKAAAADSASAAPKEAGVDPMVAALKEAGADLVAATLLETRQQLASLLPVLVQGHDDGRDGAGGAHGPSGREPRAGRAADLEVAAGARTP